MSSYLGSICSPGGHGVDKSRLMRENNCLRPLALSSIVRKKIRERHCFRPVVVYGLNKAKAGDQASIRLCANYLTARCLGFPLVRRVKDSELAKLCGNRDGTINRLVQCLTHGRHTRKPVF